MHARWEQALIPPKGVSVQGSVAPESRGCSSCSAVLHGFGDSEEGFPLTEDSPSLTVSVSSCKDHVSFATSLGLGWL